MNKVSMKNWVKEDQPRYKMEMTGMTAMTDAEILSLVIGSGIKNESSLDIAKNILQSTNYNLPQLWRANLNALLLIKGMGKAKASAILAMIELSKRREASMILGLTKITNSRDAFNLFKPILADQPYEIFGMIMLNKANKVIKNAIISEGGVSGTVVDPKKIFKIALDCHSSSIILGHNHPSGNLQPSEPDHKITQKIKSAGQMLDIAVLDHIIVGDDSYYSYADECTL